jgi:hypothetical protein
MRRHRQKKKSIVKAAGASATIRATPERAQHDEIDVELRSKRAGGAAAVSGDFVSTQVRKLLEQGVITNEEADAATFFRTDHDLAFASCRSSLCASIGSSSGTGSSDMEEKFFHASRFRQAQQWLRPNLFRIAEAAILGSASFTTLGAMMLPRAQNQDHIAAGKTMLAITIIELLGFYGTTRQFYR